mgnify:CR=1 FL=1
MNKDTLVVSAIIVANMLLTRPPMKRGEDLTVANIGVIILLFA